MKYNDEKNILIDYSTIDKRGLKCKNHFYLRLDEYGESCGICYLSDAVYKCLDLLTYLLMSLSCYTTTLL